MEKLNQSSRLAKNYSLSSLIEMQKSVGIALDRAKGRHILPARRRLWSIMDAIEKKHSMMMNSPD